MNKICDGVIDYHGDPYNVDEAGHYCTTCGAEGDFNGNNFYGKSGQSVPHEMAVGGYEREVIEAAKVYRKASHDVVCPPATANAESFMSSTHYRLALAEAEHKAQVELFAAVDRLLEAEGEK